MRLTLSLIFFLSGKVNIDINVAADTDRVIVHSKDLSIDSVKINNENGIFEIDEQYELLTVKKSDNSNIQLGKANVEIEFSGDMKNRIVGLYTSSYKSANGENR